MTMCLFIWQVKCCLGFLLYLLFALIIKFNIYKTIVHFVNTFKFNTLK